MHGGDAAIAAVAARAGRLFTPAQARGWRLTEPEIRQREHDRWVRLYARVFRHPGAPETWRGNLRAACFAGEPHAVLSHRSAARIYGLPGGREDLVELMCPRWRRSRAAGLVV